MIKIYSKHQITRLINFDIFLLRNPDLADLLFIPMHKPSKNELYQYRTLIHNKFSEIFFSKNDPSLSNHDLASISTTYLNTYVTP